MQEGDQWRMVQLPVMHQASICDVKFAEEGIAVDSTTLSAPYANGQSAIMTKVHQSGCEACSL